MKYIFTIFAALAVAGVSAIPLNGNRTDLLNGNRSLALSNMVNILNGDRMEKNPLDKDLLDFVKLVPLDKLRPIVDKYLNDSKLIISIHYALSEEYHKLVYAVEALPEHHKYVLYLQESGFDKIRELKMIHEILGMKDYVPPSFLLMNQFIMADSEGGLSGFIKEYVDILPAKEIKELHQKKLKESAAFKKFSSYMLSEKLVQLSKALAEQKAFKEFLQKSLEHGIDYVAVQDLKLRIIGFRP
ncbi:hypothetical protein M0802_001432 [Mischocyttarus mexicanus]|nr:hypothetical protein M0802_001432 [Mischocyttarus mexicanus]